MSQLRIINKVFNPFWSVLFLAFAALLAIFGLHENVVAYIVCLSFLAIVILHPVNGIYFLLLVIPFFLGNSKRPYYLMLEFFVYAMILSAIFQWFSRKKLAKSTSSESRGQFLPHAYPILLFLAVSLCSLPLNLKELFWDIWAWSSLESLRTLGSSHEGSNLYYVRSLLNVASAVLLYFVTVFSITSLRGVQKTGVVAKLALPSTPDKSNLPDSKPVNNCPAGFTEVFKPMAVVALITIIFGFLFFYDVIPHSGGYLSLSLVGKQVGAMTAFAYNRGYLGQYLIVTLPLIAFFLSGWRNHRLLSLTFFLIVIACVSAIAFTLQRGPVIALISQVLLFLVLYWYVSGRKRKRFLLSLGIIIGLVAVFLIADHFFVGGKGLKRLTTGGFDYRGQLWKASSQMFVKNPLLGIGLGKHHYFFPEYAELVGIPWRSAGARTTAHNVYLHILAEQGILGLGCFIFLIGTIFITILRQLRVMTHLHRTAALAITVSLGGWLVYGLSQYMFYLRIMQIFFWVMLGFLTVILRDYVHPTKISKKTLAVTAICLLLFFSHRIFTVTKYPFPEKYSVGFYNWEIQPDGTKAHWMGKRAAMRIPVEGKELILKCKATLPDLNLRPQKVHITTSEGYSKEIVLNNQDCVEIKLYPRLHSHQQLVSGQSEYIWIKLKTDYVIIPSRKGWSNDTRTLGVVFYDINWAPI